MSSERPNILLITTDQQRFDAIGMAARSDCSVLTPHLDWLADTGIHFSRAYTDCPICGPARRSIMLGRPDFENRQWQAENGKEPLAHLPTLPRILSRSGYQTRGVGKMHFHPVRAHHGFEHIELPFDYLLEAKERGWDVSNFGQGLGQNEMTPGIRSITLEQSLTHWTASRSIRFIENRDETRPFFLWTSFTKPHPPLDPGPESWELYQHLSTGKAVYGDWSSTWDDVPAGYRLPSTTLSMSQRLNREQWQLARRAYFALITEVDYQIGRLIARIRELDLLKNTWIIFTSDHGEMLGDHHISAKQVFFEGSAHVPLIIRPPGDWDVYHGRVLGQPVPRGIEDKRISTLADLMPSILEMTGEACPDSTSGQSLLQASTENKVFFGQHDPYFCVQLESWRLHWCAAGGDSLLFNLEADPMEEKNLRGLPEAADTESKLHRLLLDHLRTYAPHRVKENRLLAGPIADLEEARTVKRWPGFHSPTEVCDTLH
jgi:arylsulfatase